MLETLIPLAVDAYSAYSASKGQSKANAAQMAFNSQEAQKQRDWEERMFGSRYQTTRKDLEAAGYNPLMALGLNPAVPGGVSASANPQSTTESSSRIMSSSVSNALEAATKMGVIGKLRSEVQTAKSESKSAAAKALVETLDADAYSKLPGWARSARAWLTAGSGVGGILAGVGVGAGGLGSLVKNVANASEAKSAYSSPRIGFF